jgi:hypothetical protein
MTDARVIGDDPLSGQPVGVAVRWRRGHRLGVAGERKKESAVWDRRRPARKGEKVS